MREKKQGLREQERQRRIQKLREKNYETKIGKKKDLRLQVFFLFGIPLKN